MGTMDVISLDDTLEGSLFIIDEEPMVEPVPNSTTIIPEVTNKLASKRKKRRSEGKKKKKKTNSGKKSVAGSKWLVLGPKAKLSNNIISQMKGANSSHDDPETIVIQSDEDDMDIIELSDDDIGTIGGELSKSVQKAQDKLSLFQRRGETITGAWPSKSKKNIPEPPISCCSLDIDVTRGASRDVTRGVSQNLTRGVSQDVTRGVSQDVARGVSQDVTRGASGTLRPIVIDGSNVAFGHGHRTTFSSKGLAICCDYFLKRGHTVKCFIPQFRRRHHATSDFHILDKLEKDKILVFTPSRRVNGKHVVSYDDRYIVEYATKCGGVIVSRDNYHDLLSENKEWKETINKRLLMFTWVDDMIMFPQDPLGRSGPSLDEFLSFPREMPEDDPVNLT